MSADRRHLQIGEKIKRTLGDMSSAGKLEFATRELFSINEVRPSKGYENAVVFVSAVLPSKTGEVAAALSLHAAKIRRLLAAEAALRSTPELRFAADESEARAARIETILGSL